MYIIKNSFKNISRNKGRNILYAVIVLTIIITIVVSIIINVTTGEIIKDYKSRFGNVVTIDYDYEKLSKDGAGNIQKLTLDQQIDFSKSDLLKKTTFEGSLPAKLINIKPVPGTINMDDLEQLPGVGGENGAPPKDFVMPNANLFGSNREDISNDFNSGARKITDGELFKKINECIISEQLAKLNGLSVGDSIELKGESSKNTKTQKLIISGIFKDLTMLPENSSYEEYSESGNRNNEILTSFETISNSSIIDYTIRTDPFLVFYTLKDPAMLADFKKELADKGLQDYYRPITDEQSYKKIVGPVESMKNITITFLIVVLVLGAIILMILTSFSIRERKYEIGVLRAIGMSKFKVAAGLVFEMLIITSFCLVIGLFAGTAISQPVGNLLLSSQIEAAKEEYASQTQSSIFERNNHSAQEASPLSEVDLNLNSQAIILITAISLVLMIISSLGGILYITKLEPIRILSERN